METHLPSFKEGNPQLEVVTELIRGQHPHLKGFYSKNLSPSLTFMMFRSHSCYLSAFRTALTLLLYESWSLMQLWDYPMIFKGIFFAGPSKSFVWIVVHPSHVNICF